MLTYEDLPRELNLTTYFLDRNIEEGRGDRTALICGKQRHSYTEVAATANRVGNVLKDLGVRMEERVLLALSDSLPFVASWYGVLKIGAVVGEVYTFLQPADFAYYLNYSRARVVVADAQTLPALRAARPDVPGLEHIVVVDAPAELQAGELSFEQLIEQADDELAPAPTGRDDVAMWKFTTGSTGKPKAAVHLAHDAVFGHELYGRGVLDLSADDVVLPVPKLFFGYARDVAALFTFGVGGAGLIFPERATPERLFALIAEHRPTVLVHVPTMIRAMVDHPSAPDQDLTCLRCAISAGEGLPEDLHRRWDDAFGVELLNGLGSSESFHIYISNRPGAVKHGSVGQLVEGYEAQVVNKAGAAARDGEAGELWIRGEGNAIMYFNDHEATKRRFEGDWIRSGDLVERDADGYYWFVGRADELLKISGIWVAPAEIEDCLRTHSEVDDCAVTGVERDGLVTSVAFVVTSRAHGDDVFATELQDHVRTRLSPHKYPREIRFVDELPRSARGKVDTQALKRAALDEAPANQLHERQPEEQVS